MINFNIGNWFSGAKIGFVIFLIIFSVIVIFTVKWIIGKRKYKFKVHMFVPRQNTFVTKIMPAAILKDEKGIELFSIKRGFRNYLFNRQLPPQEAILPDNSVFAKQVGINNVVFLNPKLDMDGNAFSLTPFDANVKFATLYEIKKADSIIKPFKQDLKQWAPQIGIILLFVAVIILTYIIWKNMDFGAMAQAAKINAEAAKANQQVAEAIQKSVDKLASIR